MSLRLLFFLLLSSSLALPAPGQSTADRPVRLVDIAAPSVLDAGALGHFRAQVATDAQRPVNYLWDLGDGTLSVGPLVSHVYGAPGTYTLTVQARNAAGRDTLSVNVTVRPPPAPSSDPSTPTATSSMPLAVGSSTPSLEASTPETSPSKTEAAPRASFARSTLFGRGVPFETPGMTWVVKSDLWAERAEDVALAYRLQGFRAAVYTDTSGRGSPAYRVVVGHFPTVHAARSAAAWLPPSDAPAWLLSLPPSRTTE